jgi:UPF0042 nucleotide-binding protein
MDQPSAPPAPAPPATAPARVAARRRAAVPLLVVTGLSGAGKSLALNALEDFGYEAVDNLPLSLLPELVRDAGSRPIAVGIDSRTRDFRADRLWDAMETLYQREDLAVSVVFLDCDDDVLVRRYTETRRRHPLAVDRPVSDGIALERREMASVRDRADYVFDTTVISGAELKRLLAAHFAPGREPGLAVAVTSFSYRRGLPREADLVVDVRFLANPHYVPELRPLTGRDPAVGSHVAADPAFPVFFERLGTLLLDLVPRYGQEGKSYLTIAVGCTGGRHRSVYVAERLAGLLLEAGHRVTVLHRDTDLADG